MFEGRTIAEPRSLETAAERVHQILVCLRSSMPQLQGLADLSGVEISPVKDRPGVVVGSLIEPGVGPANFYFGIEVISGYVVCVSIQQNGRWAALTGHQMSTILLGNRRARIMQIRRLRIELFGF